MGGGLKTMPLGCIKVLELKLNNIEDLLLAINKYITPLLNNNGFEGPYIKNYAYEYHYYFIRKNMAIHYWCEIGNDLPRLTISFYKKQIDKNIAAHPYRYYEYPDLEPNSAVLKIYEQSWKRIEPTVKDYIKNIEKPKGKVLSENLEADYQNIGSDELDKVVLITEDFLRKNIDLLKKENTDEIRKYFKKKIRATKFKNFFVHHKK